MLSKHVYVIAEEMNFRIMFLISKEKYEALNKRVSSQDITEHNYSPIKSLSPSSIPHSSTFPTQELLNQNSKNIKQNPSEIEKSITVENIPSSDQKVEQHLKVIECPMLVKGKNKVKGLPVEESCTLPPESKKRKLKQDQNHDSTLMGKRVKTTNLKELYKDNGKRKLRYDLIDDDTRRNKKLKMETLFERNNKLCTNLNKPDVAGAKTVYNKIGWTTL